VIKFKNVLLIDDDEDYLFLTKHSLEKLHLFEKVNTLFSGYEALNFIADNCVELQSGNCPSVIFVDNKMPGMNGFAFLEKFMNIAGLVRENFQIYMVSSFTNDPDKAKLVKYNIQGFINKPLNTDKLKTLFN
jgi:CheY-like chemotaxis protein